MFRASNFDKLLDKATSNLRLDPDWPTILQICDLIRQNDCSPKYAVTAIKKKLYSQNPHQAMFALLTLESVVKNCGSGVHDEVTSKAFCEMLRDLVKITQHEHLRNKILELIQAWAFAFRNASKYRSVQDTVNILKAEGFKFPTLKESDAMFSADTAPEWADGEVCHRCRVAFSLMVRRHHCRACGQVFCQQCSSKTSTLPKFGIEKEVRVCDACFDKVSRPPPSGVNISSKLEIVDTSNDYGPTQPQKRAGGKTAEELQEEEELQLALALSQSEAEHKEKERKTRTHIAPDPTPHHPTVSPTPSSVSASPEHSTQANSELSRYLDRSYWEQRLSRDTTVAPTAPAPASQASDVTEEFPKPSTAQTQDDDAEDKEIDEFVEHLKSQVEIFVNRMKSNSSRGRSIANDTAVQTLFMNITAMHSRLLRLIQQQDDKRVYLESLQDKVAQIRDSRAALDTLRAEHAARAAAAAEAAERQRQMQMATKLQAMRKKKHEYLQYQRQLALQRVQEQEREMQMRQEQQKHQYMMSSNNFYMPSVSMPQFPTAFANQQAMYGNQFHPQMIPQSTAENMPSMPGQPQMSTPNMPLNLAQGTMQSIQQPNFALSTTAGSINIPASAQQTMNQQTLRANLAQQQMLLQQMHQMRMPQAMHQLGPQNVATSLPQNIPQQNGQNAQLPKQLPNQQPPNSMMPLLVGQQNVAQAMMNANNAMLGLQMQNMRVHPNAAQIPVTGYPSMNIPNQPNTQAGSQPQSMPQPQINAPGQQITMQGSLQNQQLPSQQLPGHPLPGQSLPGQPIPGQPLPGQSLPGQQLPGQSLPGHSLPGQPQQMQMNNNMPPGSQTVQGQHPTSQVSQTQGQQIPQNPHHQMSHIQMPGQGMQPPGPHMMMQGQQIPNIPQQGHQMINSAHAPQGQLPPGQGQQMNQGQPINQGQQVNQGSIPPQQGQQMPQNQLPPGANQMQMSQPMQMGSMPQQLPQGPIQGMPGMPQMSAPQMQQLPGQPAPQNMQGQQMKMQQQNFNNAPQGQQVNNQQAQTSVKSENNNNTAELISFD